MWKLNQVSGQDIIITATFHLKLILTHFRPWYSTECELVRNSWRTPSFNHISELTVWGKFGKNLTHCIKDNCTDQNLWQYKCHSTEVQLFSKFSSKISKLWAGQADWRKDRFLLALFISQNRSSKCGAKVLVFKNCSSISHSQQSGHRAPLIYSILQSR